jgi:Ni,Fe-hydrogenase III large subunit/Ni,Fe-hydrogenase III component G
MIGLPLGFETTNLAAPVPIRRALVDRDQWMAVARKFAGEGGRLVAMWGLDRGSPAHGPAVCAAYAGQAGLLWVELALAGNSPTYPDLVPFFACANRLQRAAADLSGIHCETASDRRPWLDHGLWGIEPSPLRRDGLESPVSTGERPAPYSFVRVEGDGVHEIAVGPVHAGIIEPGHFRFSVVGEKVLRLEERLGYTHKGIERRFQDLPASTAHRLAGRVSGDSTVAFCWAYCMALESACAVEVPERAQWLRALMLERERVANHLGDLGALGNDAALSFGLAQFSRLREDWHRLSGAVFGHRFMMDVVEPGGLAHDVPSTALDLLRRQCDEVERDVQTLRGIYDNHAGLQDRFLSTGRIAPELAARLGLTGLAGRASAQCADLRFDQAWEPYRQLGAKRCIRHEGDVAARVAVRFDELFESFRLQRELCARAPGGRVANWLPQQPKQAFGAGWVEGWRGEVFVALELGADARIVRCHCHDPSWQNWPVIEHAIIGNIVPDFPLINKSFNLSYSGHDL